MGWVEDAARNMLKSTGQRTLVPVSGSRGPQGARPACKPRDRDPSGGTNDIAVARQQHNILDKNIQDIPKDFSNEEGYSTTS
jgi:hypothetical protein